jgi:uncharacterized heparinase superfamily protein
MARSETAAGSGRAQGLEGQGHEGQGLESWGHLPRDQVLGRLGYAVKRPLFALPFYGLSLSSQGPTRLEFAPNDPWPGNAEAGAAMIRGHFTLVGQTIETPRPLWRPLGSGRRWREALHGFAWLRDLRAAGGGAARRGARELVAAWVEQNADAWDPLAWSPAVTGRRVANWLGHFEFFAASAAIEFRHRLLYEIARQTRHLNRALPAGLAGAEAIAALKGLILSGACLPDGEAWRERGLELLRRELPRQLRPDGGQAERSPARHFEVLRDLIDIRAALSGARGRTTAETPAFLQAAIEQMAPVLRLLQHGDGGLALFNDSTEGEGLQVDMVLERAGRRGRPLMSAPQSGFHRLQAGRTLVLVDTGAPPGPGLDLGAHAGTLSLEVSVGRERLVVNCGAHPSDPSWRKAQRSTAAHSTLVLDDVNSSELARDGTLRRRPQTVMCRREEAEGSVWLEASHDGYRRRFGQIHRRRLFLAASGDDLRGEDCLDGRGGERFAIRFHLHPEVQANLAQGGTTVLLRLPKGGGWRLRVQGAQVSLEDSVYLGLAGEPQRSQQVVLSGPVAGPNTLVKWALKRESKGR